MKNKNDVYDYLSAHNIEYEAVDHPAIFTIDEMLSLNLPLGSLVAKNLFLRDDKKRNYYLVVMKEDKTVDLKQLRDKVGSRPLSFASENDLNQYLNLSKGSVTPFGVFNDKNQKVTVYLDSDFETSLIGIHPIENTATVWLKTSDLVDLIKSLGNDINYINLNIKSFPEKQNHQTMGIANPWVLCVNMERAKQLTGFTLEIDNYQGEISVFRNELIEIRLKDNRLVIRKAKGAQDISGDSNTYSEIKSIDVIEKEVILKGNNNLIFLATWFDAEYSYSLSSKSGLDELKILEIIETIK